MKRLIFTLLVLSLLVNVTYADSQGAIFPDGKLKLNIIRYDPSPVTPGIYFDLWLRAEAIYSSYSQNDIPSLRIELIPSYPFSLDSSENKIKELGTLQEGSISEFKYRIRVDENAAVGTNLLRFNYYSSDNPAGQISSPLDIEVGSLDTTLLIIKVEATPTQIPPGSSGTIDITVQNLAGSLMRDITLTLNMTSDTIPISPLGQSSEKKIGKLIAGEEKVTSFDVIILADAESKIYKVPIELNYYDELGEKYTKKDIIGVIVGDQPDLLVSIDSTDIIRSKSAGKVTFGLINKGTVDARFLNLKLNPNENYEITSTSNMIYIGDLDSDDSETADFNLYVKDVKGNLILPVSIDYRDANNNQYTESMNVTLNLYSYSEIRKYNLGEKKSYNLLFFVIILVSAYYGYKRWKRKR